MPRPTQIRLTGEERRMVTAWSHASSGEHRLVERARMVLLCSEDVPTREIARGLRTRPARVSKWRQRFARQRLSGLQDAARSGKPKTYGQQTERRILAQLDEPAPEGYSQWSGPLLARALGAGLYLHPPEKAVVLRADEKPHIQVLERAQVVADHPAQDLHVILDNLNTHKPKHERWLARHPRVHFRYTPTYSSWLNLAEVWFSDCVLPVDAQEALL